MKTFCFAFLYLIFFAVPVFSQENTKVESTKKYQVDKSKPSVYLTFEKFGGKKPIAKSNEDNSERISLRLHNNTPFPIAVDANFYVSEVKTFPIILSDGGKVEALPNGAEVDVCHESEAMGQMTAEEFLKIQVPKQIPSYYNCRLGTQRGGRGDFWIQPGNSIIFSVPREFLAKNLKIYTLFNYEWESDKGQMNADEPHHRVYFYSTDLPN